MAEAKNEKGTLLDAAAEFEKIEAMKSRLLNAFEKAMDKSEYNLENGWTGDGLTYADHGSQIASAYAELVKAQASLG